MKASSEKLRAFLDQPSTIALAATFITAIIALSVGNTAVIGHIPYYYMQFLPVNAIREDPIGSIAYLHSQLPLENTAFTIIANIFRFTTANPPYTNDFWKQDTYWLGILCKQIITLYIYHYALVKTGFHFFGKRFGITSALAIALLPSTLMYFLFPYSALTSAALYGLIISTLLCEKKPATRLGLTAASISALALSHNLFSYITTFPLVLYFLADLFKNYRIIGRKIFAATLILVAIPIGWSVKNYLIFNITSLTSWSGCALGQSITAVLPRNKQVDTSLQDGWARAFKAIQSSPTYNPQEKYQAPIVLHQRMKGEGIRNWNHISVIKACQESYDYNKELLRKDPELRQNLLVSIKERFTQSLGRLGSQFNCGGCDFSYKDLGFTVYGNLIDTAYKNPAVPTIVSAWHLILWYLSPGVACVLLLRNGQRRIATGMAAVLAVNILQSAMAVSLSTIENERMLWMLDNASIQCLYASAFLLASLKRAKTRRHVSTDQYSIHTD